MKRPPPKKGAATKAPPKGPPAKVAVKPKAGKKPLPKPRKGRGPAAYRSYRKWTIGKLTPFVEDAKATRARIHSDKKGALLATELLDYLRLEEKHKVDWAAAAAAPAKKIGRPKKGEGKAVKAPRPVKDPAATLAKAKAGKLLKKPVKPPPAPPKAPAKKAPPKVVKAPPKPPPKLPPKKGVVKPPPPKK